MEQLLVKVPITTNGINPVMINGQIQYKEVKLAMGAKKDLEKINAKLPEHLKRIITVVNDTPKKAEAKKAKDE